MIDLIWIIPACVVAGRLAWDLYGLARNIVIDMYIQSRS